MNRKMCERIFTVSILAAVLSGCSLDATIGFLVDPSQHTIDSKGSTMAVAPSALVNAQDESGTYLIQSTVGEITSGVGSSESGVYQAEVSINYQKM